MPWLNKFLLIAVFFSQAAQGQIKAAPPYFNSSNSLGNIAALTRLDKKLSLIKDSGALLQILHLGDSHVNSGFFSEVFADSLNRFFFNDSNYNKQVVELTIMAKNGATSKYFLNEPYNSYAVQELQPDIIIVSLGTNEAQNLYSAAELQQYFSQLLAQIKQDAPAAIILFTTPGDALRKTTKQIKKRKRSYTVASYSANTALPTVVNFIKNFAADNNAAYWDWNAVMGGRGAIVRWVGHSYANTDRVHLTEKGYNLQGWLLATAFIKYLQKLTANP